MTLIRNGLPWIGAVAAAVCVVPGYASDPEEVPAPILAKIVRILAVRAGSQGRIACTDSRLTGELRKLGVQIDPDSMVAWAGTLGEVKALHPTRRLILCGRLDFLPAGGSIAIVIEEERPAIYLHMRHLGDSKVLIPPDLYDMSTRMSR